MCNCKQRFYRNVNWKAMILDYDFITQDLSLLFDVFIQRCHFSFSSEISFFFLTKSDFLEAKNSILFWFLACFGSLFELLHVFRFFLSKTSGASLLYETLKMRKVQISKWPHFAQVSWQFLKLAVWKYPTSVNNSNMAMRL